MAPQIPVLTSAHNTDAGGSLRDIFLTNRDAPCLIDAASGKTFTYGDVSGLACGLAGLLAREGVKPGQAVAACAENGVECVVFFLACLAGGYLAAPLHPALAQDDARYILDTLSPGLVLASPGVPALPPGPWVRRDLDACVREAAAAPAPWPLAAPRDTELFTLHFTSGSTGRPKGVFHRVGSLLGAARAYNAHMGIGPQHRHYHVMPMSYMAGLLNGLLSPLMAGGSVVLGRAFDARSALNFWKAPLRHGVTTMWLAPTMIASLLRLDRDAAGTAYCREHVPFVSVGTAPLPPADAKAFEERYGTRVCPSYGLSETLFVSATPPAAQAPDGACGTVLAGVEMGARPAAADADAGDAQELLVRTAYLMAGYLDPATGLPDALDPETWFPTGDIGVTDAAGWIRVTDRIKDLIIRGGVNIAPRAVERVLAGHPAVADAAVLGLPDAFYGETVAAALILRPGFVPETVFPELTALCRERLAPASVPARFFALEEFPVSVTGKVLKRRLKDRLTGVGAP